MPSESLIETGILIIGGGISGLFASMKAREQGVKVTLVDKGYEKNRDQFRIIPISDLAICNTLLCDPFNGVLLLALL